MYFCVFTSQAVRKYFNNEIFTIHGISSFHSQRYESRIEGVGGGGGVLSYIYCMTYASICSKLYRVIYLLCRTVCSGDSSLFSPRNGALVAAVRQTDTRAQIERDTANLNG